MRFRAPMARPLTARTKYLLQRLWFGGAARLFPSAEWAHFHLGNAHAEHGQPDLALQPWSRACQREPPRPAAVFNLAAAWLERERVPEGVALLERLVATAPDQLRAHQLLARAHQRQKAIGPAIEAHRQVLRLAPDDDASRLMLALLLERTGRAEEARELYARVVDPQLLPKARQRLAALGVMSG